ncbi:MAG: hypothetical protein KGQ49_01790 [Verrucomicrobia bacterium]|nr:hypothetical protein [Verrucomicrobiota bacterium]MBU6446113.1 hypothetical protein [Verrucomicrobiota bacterium]MDE3047170.1 hypothetical protein [Verrucomicrobiota bacterium]
MFLEKCGKLFFLQMRPLFFFALAALPFLGASLFLFQESSKMQDLEERFASAAKKERLAMDRRDRKERFIHRYSQSNPYFLDQNIESFRPLQAEKRNLESLLHHPAFPDATAISDRLHFIEENALMFQEEKIETSKEMKETQEHMRHPVQMDESDLKQILALIEDVPIENNSPAAYAPQLLITDFHLKKLETPLHTEVFEVRMDLIKREFTKP